MILACTLLDRLCLVDLFSSWVFAHASALCGPGAVALYQYPEVE